MAKCYLCPRGCGADRDAHRGACNAPSLPYVARADLHMWEEPCISGRNGSGTIFFCGCNLDCLFCQNHEISRGQVGSQLGPEGLAALMLRLQDRGAHNVNLVSPAPFLPVIREAVPLAREGGLRVPVVYNTNAYEKVEALRSLEGLVDVYLPDLKYVSAAAARKYSGAADYFDFAAPAIGEMYRQVGGLVTDGEGMAARGLIVRHLVLPGSVDETRRVLDHIAQNLPGDVSVSLMSQYVPCHRAMEHPPLDRKLMKREYARAVEYCLSLGLDGVTIQGMDSANGGFTPEFNGILIS